MIATLILISIQAFGSSIWLIIQHPSTTIVYHTIIAEMSCNDSPAGYTANVLAYNSILMIFSTYYAFRARKVPQNFNEVKYIGLTLYIIYIICLAIHLHLFCNHPSWFCHPSEIPNVCHNFYCCNHTFVHA